MAKVTKKEVEDLLAGAIVAPATAASGGHPLTTGTISASKIAASSIPSTKISLGGIPDSIFSSKPSKLQRLFGIDWANSQLKAVADDLDLTMIPCSIAGGALVRHLMGTDIFKGDFDIFPHTDDAKLLLIDRFKVREGWHKGKFAYSFDYKLGARKTKVQIIERDEKAESLAHTLGKFDFEHCKIAYSPQMDSFWSSGDALTTLAQRKVHLSYVRDPLYSLGRALKYKRMGFDADAALEQLALLAMKKQENTKLNSDDSDALDVFAEIAELSSS
jgi:hypothetical protein